MKKCICIFCLVLLFACEDKPENLESPVKFIRECGQSDTMIVRYYGFLKINNQHNLVDQNDNIKAENVTNFSVISTKLLDSSKTYIIKK